MANKRILRILIALASILTISGCATINNSSSTSEITSSLISVASEETSSEQVFVDYASQFKYDETSNRAREVVTLRTHVDGDTSHFNSTVDSTGILKARYLAIDTPESTGKVQPWGKAASRFTKEALTNAYQIMIESNDDKWNLDSTASRYLVWVWYRPTEGADWKLLNLEIMQNGLAAAKNIGSTCYSEIMNKAYSQAVAFKLKYYSDEKDPEYPYGNAISIDLRELRTNIEEYKDQKISVDGLVTRIAGQTAYIESYDAETDRTYGLPVYMGYTAFPIIEKGNILTFVGIVQLYETAGTYQLSGLTYIATKPDYKDNIKLISTGNAVVPTEITGSELNSDGELLQATNVTISNLRVNEVYTTDNGGNNDDAMTLTCSDSKGVTTTIRTSVLYDKEGNLITEADVLNKTISITSGIVDKYNGSYQIHLFSYDDLVINE